MSNNYLPLTYISDYTQPEPLSKTVQLGLSGHIQFTIHIVGPSKNVDPP